MGLPAIPDYVRDCVLGWFGADGQRWLDAVPQTAERLCEQWRLNPSGEPFDGGSHSYVLPVERGGEPAVLKVIYRDDENAAEPTALRDYDGEGAVRLYEYDAETGAMLLERAAPGGPLLEYDRAPDGDPESWRWRIETACRLYRRLWRAPGPLAGFPQYPVATDLLSGWEGGFDVLAPHWRERAEDLRRALADPGEVGIANRDTHMGNIVAAEREPWLLLDPKPYLAERAFDAGYFVFRHLEHGGPLSAAELVRAVAENLEADVERVKAWATLRALVEAAEVTESEAQDFRTRESCVTVAATIDRV